MPTKRQLGIHEPPKPTAAAMTAKERLDMLYKKAQQKELEELKLERQKLDDALNPTSNTSIDFYGDKKPTKSHKSKKDGKKDKDKKTSQKKGVEVILDHKYDKLMSYGG